MMGIIQPNIGLCSWGRASRDSLVIEFSSSGSVLAGLSSEVSQSLSYYSVVLFVLCAVLKAKNLIYKVEME